MLLFCLLLSSLINLRGCQQQQAESWGMKWRDRESNPSINGIITLKTDLLSQFYRDYSFFKENKPQNIRKSLTQESVRWKPVFPIPR